MTASGNKDAKDNVTNPKYSEFDAPQTGGVSSTPAEGGDLFNTEGNQPVRDKEADESKGTPVTRFFTKDGTPVEPSTIPTGVTPSNLTGPNADMRDDVVAVVEYIDEGGNTVTHDSLKTKEESKEKQSSDK
jgi:hypothetical protein